MSIITLKRDRGGRRVYRPPNSFIGLVFAIFNQIRFVVIDGSPGNAEESPFHALGDEKFLGRIGLCRMN